MELRDVLVNRMTNLLLDINNLSKKIKHSEKNKEKLQDLFFIKIERLNELLIVVSMSNKQGYFLKAMNEFKKKID